MFFLRTLQPPLTVQWGERVLTIPKFTVEDAVAWGSQIQSDRDSKATDGMEDNARREFFAFYPSIPPDINEIRKLVRSIDGVKYVVRRCLSKATVTGANGSLPALTGAEIDAVINTNGTGRLAGLAHELSDLYDDLKTDPKAAPAGAGPSKPSNPPASKESPATGPTT